MTAAWSFREGSVEDAGAGSGGSFAVGPWTVEPALHRLALVGSPPQGEPVRVEPKVMEVLVHLASRAPRVVSREELQEAVWGTPYVSEDLPRRAVYELRKVFGDDPKAPRFIETIPRAGYRLVAPVTWPDRPRLPGGPRGVPVGDDAPPPAPTLWRRVAPVLAILLLAAALVAAYLRSHPEPASASLRPLPLTTHPGIEYDPAFSPDGSRVAYLRTPDSSEDAEMTLHVQLVGTASSLRLNEETADFAHPIQSPTWSPDGTELAYLRWRSGEGWGVYRVPSLGGSERKVVALGQTDAVGLAWSPDGRWFALGLAETKGGPLALHRVSIDTRERERLTEPPATSAGDRLPAWSPDGSEIAFVRNLHDEASEVRVVAAAGGRSRSLLPGRHKIADVDWSPDGRRLLVAVHEGGRHRLWSLDVATGEARRMAELGEDTRWLSVARRGGRLAYGRARWQFEVRRYDLGAETSTPVPALTSTFHDSGLDLSPAGDRVAFASTRSGSSEIWTSDLAGRRPLRLTGFGDAQVGQPRWLPDGRAVVFHADPDGRSDLWRVAADGGEPRRLTGAGGDDRLPSVSGDGRTVYFASNRSGDWQVWRIAAAGGEPEPVTRGGGYLARESPDGRWLYFTRWQEPGLWRMPLPDGPAEQVLGEELPAWEHGNWTVAPDGVHFVTWESGLRPYLALFSLERREVVRRIPIADTPLPSLALTATGDTAYLAQLDRIESDIVVVEGFGSPR